MGLRRLISRIVEQDAAAILAAARAKDAKDADAARQRLLQQAHETDKAGEANAPPPRLEGQR